MGKKKGRGLMNHIQDGWGEDYREYQGYQGGYIPSSGYKVKKGWDTGDAPKVCENCDWMPKTEKQKILMSYEVWKTLMNICATVKLEWQALLTGEIGTDGVVHVTGYFIPKQEVSSASVKNLDLVDDVVIAERKIVAGVHSHGNMQCFFSTTDVEDTNMSLIKHNIVVNNNNQYKAQSRVELPCGMVKFIEAEVLTIGESDAQIVGLENITERTIGFVTKHESSANTTYKIDQGLRWCPVCQGAPEEDGGVSCVCCTTSKRPMLPDFTEENYDHKYGRTYDLKQHLFLKYGGKFGKDYVD